MEQITPLKQFSLSLCVLTAICLSLELAGAPTSRYGRSTLYAPAISAPKPGSLYPRAVQLHYAGGQHAPILATFEEYSKGMPSFPIYRSTTGGVTWSAFSRVTDEENGWGMRFQPFLYELPEAFGSMPAGTLLCLGNSIPADLLHTRLEMYKSLDHGAIWSFVSHIASGGVANPDGTQDPVWEPFVLLANKKLIVYYSDERDPRHNQKIVHQSSIDGIHWGNVVDDVAIAPKERPGMPVVAKMGNGKYIMSWECVCYGTIYTSVKTTSDPESWNASDAGTRIAGSGGTPYTVWMPLAGKNAALVQSSSRSNNLFVNRAYGVPGSIWTQMPGTVPTGYSRSFVVLNDSNALFEISPVPRPDGYNDIVSARQPIN